MWKQLELYNSWKIHNKSQHSVLHVTLFSFQLVISEFGNNHPNIYMLW
jgi:hypothetical protein